MSQMNEWQIIKHNGWFPQVASCYTQEFPMDVRGYLAQWLEENKSAINFDSENVAHHDCINGFLLRMIHQLCQQIETLAVVDEASYFYKNRLTQAGSNMKIMFASDKLTLFKGFRQSLLNERQEIQRLQNNSKPNSVQAAQGNISAVCKNPFEILDEQMTHDIEQSRLHCAFITNNISQIHSKYVDIQTLQYQAQQMQTDPNNFYDANILNPVDLAALVQKLESEISQLKQQCWEIFHPLVQSIEKTHSKVMEELDSFKDEQRFVVLGRISVKKLANIEAWFSGVYECLCSVEASMHDFQNMCQQLHPQNSIWLHMTEKAKSLKNAMIPASLVIEMQPSQIIRKDTKFGPVKLRLLISNGNNTNIVIDAKGVSALLINEAEARKLFNNQDYQPEKSAIIKAAKNFPRVVKNEIEFKDIRVSEIARKVKRGVKTVVEEKFCIYFKVGVNIPGYAKNYLWITSLPIAVTSHPNQEGEAWGSVLWDNAFSAKGRQPFEVPEEVPWTSLIEIIDLKFMTLTGARRGLTEDNKRYLKEKLFRDEIPANEMVSWKLFCKDPFLIIKTETGSDEDSKAKKSLSYWEWIFSCLKILSWTSDDPKMVDRSLKKLWEEGKIVGFISEGDMTRLLKEVNLLKPGTFLLRFSENRPESIGIYYYNHRAVDYNDRIVKLNPYTIKRLKEKSLQDRILKNPLIAYLYPDIEKGHAFKNTSAQTCKTIDGYVDIGVTEYFPTYLLEKYKPGLPEQNTPSPSAWSNPSSHYSQAQSPSSSSGRSEPSNTRYTPKSSASNDNSNNTTFTNGFVSYNPLNSEITTAMNWILDPTNEFSLTPSQPVML